jgi:hypothetical protein
MLNNLCQSGSLPQAHTQHHGASDRLCDIVALCEDLDNRSVYGVLTFKWLSSVLLLEDPLGSRITLQFHRMPQDTRAEPFTALSSIGMEMLSLNWSIFMTGIKIEFCEST